MSVRNDFLRRKWKCLIEECHESGMMVTKWCNMKGIPINQYYYWIAKIRTEYYEDVVTQLRAANASGNVAVPVQVQGSSFVEITPEIACEAPKQESLSQTMAVIQKGSIRIDILSNASASIIKQILEAVHYA
jgi:hypothetical protein